MKNTFFFLFFSCLLVITNQQAVAQKILPADRKKLLLREDTLQEYSKYLITDTLTEDRMYSDSIFTRSLVRALQVRNSFYYPFDSVLGVSKIYAPDSSFRILTWNLQYDDYYSRQKGAIQMRTTDGALKLYPLRDVSEFTDKPEDSVRSRMNWIGAVYYNVIINEFKGKKFYTLFGIDPNSAMSSKKWVEVLSFNNNNEPVFGGAFFTYDKDSVRKAPKDRISLEYKKGARILMNYIDDLGIILVDHLISESNEPDHQWTYVPDGDNEAYKWQNGKWAHIDKAFDYKVDMKGVDPYTGKPPLEQPILDKQGKRDEKILQEKSDKNRSTEKPVRND